MDTSSRLVLTYAINAAWQIPIVVSAATLCSLLLARMPPKHRHILWVSALLLSVVLPFASLPRQASQQGMSSSVVLKGSSEDTSTSIRTGHVTKLGFSFEIGHHSWAVVVSPTVKWLLLACYLGLLFYRLTRLCWAWYRTARFRSDAYPRQLPSSLAAILDRCSADLAIHPTTLLCSSEALSPVTFGALRPTLVLPDEFFTVVSEADFRAAICHELAHIRRRDFLFNAAYEIALLPVCFHPAALLAKRRVDQTRELACDEMAASQLSTRTGYARSLIHIAQSLQVEPYVAPADCALGLFDTDTLEDRIRNLLQRRPGVNRNWARLLAVVSSALLAGASLGASAFSLQVAKPDPSEQSGGTEATLKLPVVIKSMTFTQVNAIDPGELQQFVNHLEAITFRNLGWEDEVKERIRNLWQDHGYFLMVASVDTHMLNKEAARQPVAIEVKVNEGDQYRLKQVVFRGATVFRPEELIALVPLKNGDILDRHKIALGFEAVQRQYVAKGYRNIVLIPNSIIDKRARTVALVIDLDEGQKQAGTVPGSK